MVKILVLSLCLRQAIVQAEAALTDASYAPNAACIVSNGVRQWTYRRHQMHAKNTGQLRETGSNTLKLHQQASLAGMLTSVHVAMKLADEGSVTIWQGKMSLSKISA